jgi:hypothetical protein
MDRRADATVMLGSALGGEGGRAGMAERPSCGPGLWLPRGMARAGVATLHVREWIAMCNSTTGSLCRM